MGSHLVESPPTLIDIPVFALTGLCFWAAHTHRWVLLLIGATVLFMPFGFYFAGGEALGGRLLAALTVLLFVAAALIAIADLLARRINHETECRA